MRWIMPLAIILCLTGLECSGAEADGVTPLTNDSANDAKCEERKHGARHRDDEDEEAPDAPDDAEFTIGRRPEPPAPPCGTCQNTGKRKEHALRDYILFEDDTVLDAGVTLGWSPCPDCARGRKLEAEFEGERRRIAERSGKYKDHERELGLTFIDFETRYLTGHFQTTPEEAKSCAKLFARLTEILRERCENEACLISSNANQSLVICENENRYLKYLDFFSHTAGHNDENWLTLARKTASFGSRGLTVIRRDLVATGQGSGLEHMAVFAFGHMLVREATDNKLPSWFGEGFSSLCESLVLENPRCYSIRYEENKVEFEASWSQAVAGALKREQARRWEVAFTLEQVGMSALDYQQCWSMVRYLFLSNGPAFAKLPDLFKSGLNTTAALEKAYELPIEHLERSWKSWAGQGR